MKNFYISIFSFFVLSGGCKISDKEQKLYVLENDEGIFVERFDSTYLNESRFNENNEIYRSGRIFVFNYFYIAPNQDTFLIEKTDRSSFDGWSFVPFLEKGDRKITTLNMIVQPGLGNFSRYPDYSQTVIKYEYLTSKGNESIGESTGVIENEKNIWLHPPRQLLFEILEINPFPFIQKPYKIGNEFSWELGVGDQWADNRWIVWTGNITNRMKYRISGKEKLNTPLGKLNCLKVKSEAESKLGKTYLTSFFNEKYGFVKLDYTNIDGSKLIMNLEQIAD